MPNAGPPRSDGRRLILASASPRRAAILRAVGYRFEVASSGVTELIDPHSDPCEVAVRFATEKAMNVQDRAPDSVVIGADTIVAIDGELLGKPSTPEDASEMLLRLRGRRHRVVTGVCVATEEAVRTGFKTTEVSFRSYASHEIDDYLATGLPFDRAGAYGIQDEPFSPVESFDACYLNVVGLPVCIASGLLEDSGIGPLDGRVECAGHSMAKIELKK